MVKKPGRIFTPIGIACLVIVFVFSGFWVDRARLPLGGKRWTRYRGENIGQTR